MDDNHISFDSEIELVTSYLPRNRPFQIKDLLEEDFENININCFIDYLQNCKEVIYIEANYPEDDLVLPKNFLFEWFVYLNHRAYLANFEKSIIKTNYIERLFCTAFHKKILNKMPKQVFDFGIHYGLIQTTFDENAYFLPFVHLVKSITDRLSTKIIKAEVWKYLFSLSRENEFERQKILSEDPNNFIRNIIHNLDIPPRMLDIVVRRWGLENGEEETLETIAQSFQITRERVRQIQTKFQNLLFGREELRIELIKCIINYILMNHGSILVNAKNKYLLLIFELLHITIFKISRSPLYIFGYYISHVIEENITKYKEIGLDHMAISKDLFEKYYFSSKDIEIIAKIWSRSYQQKMKRKDMVFLALRGIGKPAHYSEVYKQCIKRYPNFGFSEHNVHACLGRLEGEGKVVWIGVRGTFALREWGIDRPSMSILDGVTHIVKTKFRELGKPVPEDLIMVEMLKERPYIQRASVILALTHNDSITKVEYGYVPSDICEQLMEANLKNIIDSIEIDKGIRAFINRRNNDRTKKV